MKKDEKYNEVIKNLLKEKSSQVEASEELFHKIIKDINKQKRGEVMGNKVSGFKKGRRVVAIVASLILIGSLTVMGVTIGRNWVGYSNNKYKAFPSQEKVLKDVGFLPKYPKSLPGGFEYDKGGTGESKLSETGNVLTRVKEINLAYKRENEKNLINLSIGQIDEKFLDNSGSELVGNFKGIDLYYYNKDYKFVPANYELTEKDKKEKELGNLEISYGASEITLSNMQGISWYEDGLEYMIMGGNYNFTVEEMIEMAKVVIEQ